MFTVTSVQPDEDNGNQAVVTNEKVLGSLTVTKTVRLNGENTGVLGTEFWVAVYSDAVATQRVADPRRLPSLLPAITLAQGQLSSLTSSPARTMCTS